MISRSTAHLRGSSISQHLPYSDFCKNMQDEGASGFAPHAVVVLANSRLGFRRRSVDDRDPRVLATASTDRGGWGGCRQWSAHLYPVPQRSSPPDLGGELVAVVPAGGLVRARNDCFIALDLDPRDFRLPLFAALLTALEQGHGRFSFSASRTETDTAAVWLAVCGLTLSRRAAGGFSAPLNGANSGNPTNERI